VFVEAGDPKDLPRIQRNVDWLIRTRVIRDGKLIGWSYPMQSNNTDNSNTQYAVLGLDAGRRAGATIDKEVWELIQAYYVREPQPAPAGFGSVTPGIRSTTCTALVGSGS